MAVEVNAFSAQARSEFAQGKMNAEERVLPASHEQFTTTVPSTTKVETHLYMSSLPRLTKFKGYSPGTRITDYEYAVSNDEYRAGPITVRKIDLDDDKAGGYLKLIQGLPARAQKDIGHMVLDHLAAGTANKCFDGTNFFADSHAVGVGDNLITANMAASDGATHKIIALILNNDVFKPVLFQDRESLTQLQTDADTPQAAKQKEYEYWSDCRFGLGYGYWWDAVHLTITDTPTTAEIIATIIPQIVNQFRTFKLPKGAVEDKELFVHENWVPSASQFYLLTNLQLAEIVTTALSVTQYEAGTAGKLDNVYVNKATVVPTSALN